MGLWTKEQLRSFIKENKLVAAQDAQNALKDLFSETIQEILEAELEKLLTDPSLTTKIVNLLRSYDNGSMNT